MLKERHLEVEKKSVQSANSSGLDMILTQTSSHLFACQSRKLHNALANEVRIDHDLCGDEGCTRLRDCARVDCR